MTEPTAAVEPTRSVKLKETKRIILKQVSVNVKQSNSTPQNNVKYILLWLRFEWAPFYNITHSQEPFIKNNCTFTNCYVTDNRSLFGEDITKFDAILFHGWQIFSYKIPLPKVRAQHQKYIFFYMESGDNYPICNKTYDRFFNWTTSFKLDSDIPYPYILIRDINGTIVGPRRNMKWKEKMHEVDESLTQRFRNKSKAAAWFVSSCNAKSGRKLYVENLQKALVTYGLKIDIYGACGPFKCPRNNNSCAEMLKRDYYFYMSMENSFSVDYVTEKVLTALNNDAVPIVYGAANYSRFLPPGSYIEAQAHTPSNLAALMNRLIKSPQQYYEYFRWKYHYTYHDPTWKEDVCSFCAAFNNRTKVESYSSYDNFRKWWHPDFEKRCS